MGVEGRATWLLLRINEQYELERGTTPGRVGERDQDGGATSGSWYLEQRKDIPAVMSLKGHFQRSGVGGRPEGAEKAEFQAGPWGLEQAAMRSGQIWENHAAPCGNLPRNKGEWTWEAQLGLRDPEIREDPLREGGYQTDIQNRFESGSICPADRREPERCWLHRQKQGR